MKLLEIAKEGLWKDPNDTHGRTPPKGKLLATYTDKDGYTVRIVGKMIPGPGIWRYGIMRIINPEGEMVRGGYWMNWPEDDWNISKREWSKMSWEERAAREVVQQATKYQPLKDQFIWHKERPKV